MRKTLLIVILTFFSLNSFAQRNLWSKITEDKLSNMEKFERDSRPSKYELFHLDFSNLKNVLLTAPLDVSGIESNTVITFPDYTGKMSNYIVYEAPVMEEGLAERYPEIKSYVGKGVDDKTATIRFSVTLFGLHVMMTSGEAGTYYIDTYTKDLNNYIVYSRNNISSTKTFSCMTQDDEIEVLKGIDINSYANQRAIDGKFRQYRLAMACTIEYAAFHVNAAGLSAGTLAQKKAAVLSAMNVTMTRVNGIYERDMSLRMNLVANNDDVIFIDSDSFNNNVATTLINQSQSVINTTIGSANYDIGHTVSTGGGGLAGLGVVCNNSQKARGITGSPSPVGDPYDVDYVAHEIGHQFGGPHTFSGTGGNCAGNESPTNAVEPASGSTIMAYAGICGPNVQSNSDPYFHAVSIASMNAVMISSGNCAPQTNNGNNAPVISALSNYTIPRGTAFMLTGNASDSDGSASLTYCWEQTNAASGVDTPTVNQTSGPIYRSFNPTSNPTRYFPRLADLFTGNLTPTWEVTPNVARTLNFALTVRDNQIPTGGQTARANMSVTIDASRGPLSVTSQNTDQIVWTPGSTETVTWAVNNTNGSAGGANVDILYTADNGATWNVILANTPNDGSQAITVPSISEPYCRIMVKASGNIFFSVNTKDIAIGNYVFETQNVCEDYHFVMNQSIIEDAANLSSIMPLQIDDSFTITDVNVRLVANHANLSEVNTAIRAPWQATLTTGLWYNFICTSTNLDLVFDSEGSAVNCGDTSNMAATLPFSAANLAGFAGNNSAGAWRLYIADNTVNGNNSGAVLSDVYINLCRSEQVPVLSSETFESNDFVIYPNPNNGTFTIQLTATSSDVALNVHDLRGRLILSKNLKASGLINEQVSLKNAQTGIYLVAIQDGSKKITKKIIIE